jgi:hypothetical protein
MSRNTGIAVEHPLVQVPANASSDDRQGAADELDLIEVDEEVTLTMRADETKRLIQTAFGDEALDHPSKDDEITLECASPAAAPSAPRLPALRMLAIAPPAPSSRPPPLPRTTPPPPLTLANSEPPASRWRPHVTPALAQVARELLLAEDAQRRGLAQKRKNQIWLVAGIWAMAFSLVVMLALIARFRP